jgi:hypothetical protein
MQQETPERTPLGKLPTIAKNMLPPKMQKKNQKTCNETQCLRTRKTSTHVDDAYYDFYEEMPTPVTRIPSDIAHFISFLVTRTIC